MGRNNRDTRERSAIKRSPFAAEERERKIDSLGDPLAILARHIDFAAIADEVEAAAPRPSSERGGRPPYPTEVMVCILTLKYLYNLADEALEFQLLDRLSFQRFCGLTETASIPDRTTIWHFEQRLVQANAGEAVFAAVQRQLIMSGYAARGGQIVDATLVEAPRQHLNDAERRLVEDEQATPADWGPYQRRQRDTEARWTKKHGRSTFGYKLSVNVDTKYKLIRRCVVSDAAEHDVRHLDALLDPVNTNAAVYGDKGYAGRHIEQRLRDQGYRPQIQRKAPAGKRLAQPQRSRNRRIATTRARVEHIFAAMAQARGIGVRCIGKARAMFQLMASAASYNLSRLAHLREAGVVPI